MKFSETGRAPDCNAQLLIEQYRNLVRSTAWRVYRTTSTTLDIEDLTQIGHIALIEAARGFEDRGIAFGPYAQTRIRGAMIDALRKHARLSRAGMANRRHLEYVRGRLEQEYMVAPGNAAMAAATGLSPSAYFKLESSACPVRVDSIEQCYSDHDGRFADRTDTADIMIEERQLQQRLHDLLAQLSAREAAVLHHYFAEELPLEEIGVLLGVGAARVCQIKKAALEKLKVLMAA